MTDGTQGEEMAVPKRKRRACRPGPDADVLLAQLRSAEEEVQVKALHRVCPCGAGFVVYARFRAEVKRLQKDPSPAVRAAALHVEQAGYGFLCGELVHRVTGTTIQEFFDENFARPLGLTRTTFGLPRSAWGERVVINGRRHSFSTGAASARQCAVGASATAADHAGRSR